ncbi:MSMEG_0570 family nitrogen starvation response protein [Georhizobium profundi]|uniref:MSMEG_0570 family nitrogen starvation response protein n=1 Tax=Georhizobium profundi TaxID=2341112 RepID=A0A3Q8XQH2_9HYPH|nr:MSMEG_0570 family nitrogen starvation response protein [Georhizobium profundi]AZN72959.1 MSMEG_0570 family nitrogen starvation response protein [Georhizobium profundi]
MPEVYFTVLWPDGAQERCYSPSTVIKNHIAEGASYSLDEFVGKARTGLGEASDRVAARYGFACSSAMAELARIEARANALAGTEPANVRCIKIEG